MGRSDDDSAARTVPGEDLTESLDRSCEAASSPTEGSSNSHSGARLSTSHPKASRRRWPADSMRAGKAA